MHTTSHNHSPKPARTSEQENRQKHLANCIKRRKKLFAQADIHTDHMKTLPSRIKGMGFEVGCRGIDEQDVQITLKLFFSCRW